MRKQRKIKKRKPKFVDVPLNGVVAEAFYLDEIEYHKRMLADARATYSMLALKGGNDGMVEKSEGNADGRQAGARGGLVRRALAVKEWAYKTFVHYKETYTAIHQRRVLHSPYVSSKTSERGW